MSGGNKFIGTIVALFALIVIAVVLINRSNEAHEAVVPPSGESKPIPENTGPSGPSIADATTDTTAETLNTVAAQYQSIESRVEEITNQLNSQQNASNAEDGAGILGEAMSKEIASMRASILDLQQAKNDLYTGTTGNEIDSRDTDADTYSVNTVDSRDFGFSPGTLGESRIPEGYETTESAGGYVRVKPLYTSPLPLVVQSVNTAEQQEDSSTVTKGLAEELATLPTLGSSATRIPLATIPKNATLYNATAFTALVGRVPFGGTVSDPMPVKIVIGTENLAANGHRINGLKGTVFSGTAIGDWTLGCVRVELNSATFVFDDDSFSTLSSNSLSDTFRNDGFGGDSSGEDQSIGWISDRQGVPCVKGQKITDAPTRIGVLALLGGAQGAADAYAEAQETTTVSQGSTTSSLTGSNTSFLLGNTVASGISSATSDISTRFNDSFDAIYVPAGESVVVHISQTLPIDRVSSQRKLNYAATYNEKNALD